MVPKKFREAGWETADNGFGMSCRNIENGSWSEVGSQRVGPEQLMECLYCLWMWVISATSCSRTRSKFNGERKKKVHNQVEIRRYYDVPLWR